jgi:succinate dehydrogenase/fumarate reductase flavoprotein subunit
MVVCRAKTVIATAGGAARFGLPNSGHLYGVYDFPGNTGDGYMLAYRAGAALTGFEHTTRYCIVKDVNIPLLYIVLTRGARVFDALEEDITSADISISALVRRHEAGRGPMHIRLSHLPEEKIKAIEEILFQVERPVQERFHAGRGVNFRREDIELWPTDYFLCGGHGMSGVLVNDKAETTLPGLYSAGDNACVPRGHLSGAFVFGQIAAESATAFARSTAAPKVNDEQVAAFARKLEGIGARRGRVSVDELEHKVRRMINDYVVPPKNARKLNEALKWFDRLSGDLCTQVGVRGPRDVFKVLEVENIVGCAAVSAAAALERQESRWGGWHYRADYPQRDDANWLKHILTRRGESDLDVRLSHKEIERKGE